MVAWTLLLMGLTVLVPCVWLPEWRAYQQVKIDEQAERHRLDHMARVVVRERRALAALQSDPAVLARMAQRELGYRPETGRIVDVAGSLQPPEEDGTESFVPQPVRPPRWLERWARHLPDLDYDRVFCEPDTRRILMGMSVALILVGLWIPTSRRSSD
ncbi:MAG: hypothetical protein D6788_04445 [Planctomycetota bacterium]|nr:MAG: hypothetical protein D6788_04445 [Planctomycetota bacterium]